MTVQELDYIFPFVVFGYGLIMTFVLANPVLLEIAEQRLPETLLNQLKTHKSLGLICLWVGGLWTLQNLWLS